MNQWLNFFLLLLSELVQIPQSGEVKELRSDFWDVNSCQRLLSYICADRLVLSYICAGRQVVGGPFIPLPLQSMPYSRFCQAFPFSSGSQSRLVLSYKLLHYRTGLEIVGWCMNWTTYITPRCRVRYCFLEMIRSGNKQDENGVLPLLEIRYLQYYLLLESTAAPTLLILLSTPSCRRYELIRQFH